MEATLRQIAHPAYDSVKLFHRSRPSWPIAETSKPLSPIHICVFDSSYNPPTRAHLAIASSTFPPNFYTSDDRPESASRDQKQTDEQQDQPYTARLLLLSARNVDKTLKEGDASLAQRLDMIELQARHMASKEKDSQAEGSASANDGVKADPSLSNIAVAAINHPTFVGKSEIILRWLQQVHLPSIPGYNHSAPPIIRLTFLIGTDTLVRIWVPKYYTPDPKLGQDMTAHLTRFFDVDRSGIVCAHRGSGEEDTKAESVFIQSSEDCQNALAAGKIRFIRRSELGPKEMAMSSTALRKAVSEVKEEDAGEERFRDMDTLCIPPIREYIWREGLYR